VRIRQQITKRIRTANAKRQKPFFYYFSLGSEHVYMSCFTRAEVSREGFQHCPLRVLGFSSAAYMTGTVVTFQAKVIIRGIFQFTPWIKINVNKKLRQHTPWNDNSYYLASNSVQVNHITALKTIDSGSNSFSFPWVNLLSISREALGWSIGTMWPAL